MKCTSQQQVQGYPYSRPFPMDRPLLTACPDTPVLGLAHAAFIIEGPVAMWVGSCSADLCPSLARGYGCRISADRRRVTVFVCLSGSGALLKDLRAGRSVAVVFSRPATHQTIQLKGALAEINPLESGDRGLITAYSEKLAAEIASLGYGETFSRKMMASSQGELVSVSFTPNAAFEQTPGATAGQPLEPGQ